MRPPAPFQGFINDQLDGSASRNESADQQQEEHSTDPQGRPVRSVQNMVKHVKLGGLVQTHHPKGGSYRPPPTSE